MNDTSAIISVVVLYLVIDVVYVKFVSQRIALPVITAVQGGKMPRFNFVAAVVTYLILVVGFVFLVPPRVKMIGKIKNSWERIKKSLMVGGMLGFVIYGTFNGTNMSIFENYTLKMAVTDTIWGTFVFTLITFIFWTLIST